MYRISEQLRTNGNLTNYAGNAYTYGGPGNTYCPGIHQLCSTSILAFSYDANGNQYGGGRSNIGWNADDQLTTYTQVSNGYVESYSYDADGERATRTAGSTTTIYLGPLFELDVQTSNHQNTITRRTFYKLGDNIVAQRNSADTSLIYLHTDHLGSVVKATSLNGASSAVRWTYDYDPWGNITLTAGITQTLLSYTGLHKDAAQYYDHARYYDASIQHFNSADSIMIGVSNPQNLNRYSYVNNEPTTIIDPDGHHGRDECSSDNCDKLPVVPDPCGTIGICLVLGDDANIQSQLQTILANYSPDYNAFSGWTQDVPCSIDYNRMAISRSAGVINWRVSAVCPHGFWWWQKIDIEAYETGGYVMHHPWGDETNITDRHEWKGDTYMWFDGTYHVQRGSYNQVNVQIFLKGATRIIEIWRIWGDNF